MQHQDPPAREEIGPEHSPEELLAHLRGLEAALLEPEVRYSELLEQHLAEDFVEFGSSGRRYSRAEVIAALAEEGAASTAAGSPPIRW
ncbi:MAG TPA: nuclear transport factor 2 family protein, partial [Thermoanaerobaculia bacterium]|nr:nuclear transport factor 2 family protein [Thermoanaerobaculia bacterium]